MDVWLFCDPTTPTTMSPWMLTWLFLIVIWSHLRMLTDLNSESKNNDGFQKESAGFQGLIFKWTMLAFRGDSRLISQMPPEWQATRWRNCCRDSLEQTRSLGSRWCTVRMVGWNRFFVKFHHEFQGYESYTSQLVPISWESPWRWLPSEFDFCPPNDKFQNHPKKILFYYIYKPNLFGKISPIAISPKNLWQI